MHVLRKRAAEFLVDNRLVLGDEILPMLRAHLDIGIETVVFLRDFERIFEAVMVEAEHHVRIHLDEAAVAVPREARIARAGGKAFDGHIVEAQVEHGIHHARHRNARARTDRDEQRIGRIAEHAAGGRLDMRDALGDTGAQVVVEVFSGGVVGRADFGADGEARGHGEANAGHFGQVRALAAGDGLVARAGIAVGSGSKVIGTEMEYVCAHAANQAP